LKLWERTQAAIDKEGRVGAAASRTTSGGVMRRVTPNGLPYGVLSRNYCGEING
jgi:hypothetical protein